MRTYIVCVRVCIIYDTRRGSTETFARWLKESFEQKGHTTTTFRAGEDVQLEECDLVLIGSPIYYEKPLKSVMDFIKNHRDALKNIPVVVFVVCMANLFGHFAEGYIRKKYIGALNKNLPNPPVAAAHFVGWLRKENPSRAEDIRRWADEILQSLEK